MKLSPITFLLTSYTITNFFSCSTEDANAISFIRSPVRTSAAPASYTSGIEVLVHNQLPEIQLEDLSVKKPDLNVWACAGLGKSATAGSENQPTLKDNCIAINGTISNGGLGYYYISADQLYELAKKADGTISIQFQDDFDNPSPIKPCEQPNHDLRLKGNFSQLTTFEIKVNQRRQSSYGCVLDS